MILVGMSGMEKVQAVGTTDFEEEQQIPEGYIAIYDIADLYAIRNNPSGNYILMNDIDMTEATKEGGEWDQGNGWTPIESFSGIFDGNGYRISGMCIYGTISTGYVGLFGKLSGAEVKNLGLIDVNVNINVRSIYVGGIAGYVSGSSTISSCYCSGEICSLSQKSDSYSTSYTGGIVGCVYGDNNYIINCFNATEVSNQGYASVIYAGGILGRSYGYQNGYIQNCYNIANITGADDETNTYAIGCFMSFRNNYYLKDSAPKGTDKDGAGKCVLLTEAQMKNAKAYTGFDFDTVWEVDSYCDSYPYPQLKNNRVVRVSSIVLQSDPTKLVYNQGDKLEVSDAVLEITYEDEIKTTIPVTTDMLSGYDMDTIGNQTVMVSYGGVKTEFEIEVKEIPVTSVTIPEELSLYRSKTQQLSAVILPENATDKTVTWESNNPDIASVDDNGLVRAKAKGTATITVTTAYEQTAKCEVTVLVPAVSVSLDNTAVTLKEGENITLTAKILPLESTDDVEWITSNADVAETYEETPGNEQTGAATVVAKKAGTATITAYTESGVKAECVITVQKVPTTPGEQTPGSAGNTQDQSVSNPTGDNNVASIQKTQSIKVKIKTKNIKRKV